MLIKDQYMMNYHAQPPKRFNFNQYNDNYGS